MSDYITIPTSAEVWAVIKARHLELKVFSSYSAPNGDPYGNPDDCRMQTEYGFENADVPIIGAETKWEKDPECDYKRVNESTHYWLCCAIND